MLYMVSLVLMAKLIGNKLVLSSEIENLFMFCWNGFMDTFSSS